MVNKKVIFLTIFVFLIQRNFCEINFLRKLYLDKKLVEISSSTVENLNCYDEIIKNLTIVESCIDKGKIELVEEYFEKLKLCYPLVQLINFRLGEYYFLLKDYKSAKRYFEECVKNDSQFHEARKYLAKICFILKDYNDAYKHYNILSWFKPDEEVLYTASFLANRIGINSKLQEIKFSTLLTSTYTACNGIPEINVGVSTKDNGRLMKIDNVKFYVKGKFFIIDDKNKKILECEGNENNLWCIVYRTRLKRFGIISPFFKKEIRIDSKTLVVEPVENNATIVISEYGWFKNKFPQNNEYRGKLVIKHLTDQIVVINRVKLDEYLYSVVAKEIGKDNPYEALKTQAVVARTVALYRKKDKLHKYFDVCSGQHCQVYSGVKDECIDVINAVNDTIGEVVVNNGKLVHTFFHANCGGVFSNKFYSDETVISDIAEDKNYEIKDLYQWYLFPPRLFCAPSEYVHPGFSRWLRVVRKNVLSEYLNKKYNIGVLKNIEIISRKKNGYVTKLKIVGSKKTVVLNKEHRIRNIVPLGPLRSTSFIIEYNRNNDTYYFWGAGWGHGVGMCQSGVSNLAFQGENYINIIKHYYPETEVKKIY